MHRFSSEKKNTVALPLPTLCWICYAKQATGLCQAFPVSCKMGTECASRSRQNGSPPWQLIPGSTQLLNPGRPDSLPRVGHYLIPQKESYLSNSATVLQATGRMGFLKMVVPHNHDQLSPSGMYGTSWDSRFSGQRYLDVF